MSDVLEFEQNFSKLQEQFQAEKDLKTPLKVQDKKWWLKIDYEFGVKKAWELSDLLLRAQPINKNPGIQIMTSQSQSK